MTTNENASQSPDDAQPLSMKDRLLAQRKAQAGGSPPVPAAKPAAARPSASTSGAAPAAKPATSRPQGSPARPPAAPAPTRAATTRPKPLSREEAGEPVHPDVKREINLLRQRESKTMTIAWIVTGALTVACGGIYLYVTNKKGDIESIRQAKEDLLLNFVKKAEEDFDVETKAGAQALHDYIVEGKYNGEPVPWQESDLIKGKISALLSHAQRTLQRESDKEFFYERLAQVEAVASNAGTKTPDEVIQARRKTKDLGDKAPNFGDEAVKRVGAVRLSLERVFLTRLVEDAQQQSKDAATLRQGVLVWSQAENVCYDLVDKRTPDPTGELTKFGNENRVKIIQDSDTAVSALFTPDYVNQQPWIDLLAGDMIGQWQNDQLGGFQITNGVLHAVGPDANATKDGLISVPRANQWRDFQLEGEIEILKASRSTDIYLRLLSRTDAAVNGPTFKVGQDEDEVRPGKKVAFLITVIGSKLSYSFPGGDLEGKNDLPISPNRHRKGGFGATVPAGTEFKLHKFRLRLLRPDVTK